MMKKNLVPRIGGWWLLTQEFDFNIVYRPGIRMTHVDALSRNSVEGTVDNFDYDLHVFHIGLTEGDWVLAAQVSDDLSKQLCAILSKEPTTKEVVRIHKEYKLKRLYKVTPDGLRWVVPKTARGQIVFYHHDNVGHFGTKRTLQLVWQKYRFPQMKYIKRYISCCLPCLYNKAPTGRQPGFLHPIPKFDTPMHTLHIDHLGPFVLSKSRKAYLTVAVDGFTKFIFLKAVRSTQRGPVLRFLDEIFNLFGVARRIVCDRGSCFTSKSFNDYCKQLNIKINYTVTATPRANGQVERYNRTILSALSASADDEGTWDEKIKDVQWGLNTSVNRRHMSFY
jgi:transposase InsO family protein